MKNKTLFIGINAILVIAVGLIIGLVFSGSIFSGTAGIVAFAFLLFVLAIPSLIYMLSHKLNTGSRIVASMFVVNEIILYVVYLFIPKADVKIYAIIQLAIIVLTLAAFLTILGLFKDSASEKGK